MSPQHASVPRVSSNARPTLWIADSLPLDVQALALSRIHRDKPAEEAKGCSWDNGFVTHRPQNKEHPIAADRIQIAFDDHRLVANPLLLPATLAHLTLGNRAGPRASLVLPRWLAATARRRRVAHRRDGCTKAPSTLPSCAASGGAMCASWTSGSCCPGPGRPGRGPATPSNSTMRPTVPCAPALSPDRRHASVPRVCVYTPALHCGLPIACTLDVQAAAIAFPNWPSSPERPPNPTVSDHVGLHLAIQVNAG